MSNSNGFLKKFALYVPVKLLPALLTVCFVFFLYRFFPAGDYVNYSVSIACALIVAQLGAMWVGNSFVYYFSGVDDKKSLFSNCFYLIVIIGPVSGLIAANLADLFVAEEGAFRYVWLLCVAQVFFFFMSSVCQAAFMVRQQLASVVTQAIAQVSIIYFLYVGLGGVSYAAAMMALTAGYAMAALLMMLFVAVRLGMNNPFTTLSLFKRDVKSVYEYGSALAPWMLGMLVMAGADRFAIGYLGLENGDSYLSLKDLFVGAGGLLSMPLLMLVHPLIIKRFREGVFEGSLIQSSMGFLIIVFSLLWTLIAVVGLQVFDQLTGKPVTAPFSALLMAYLGVFLNCSAVYVQKRLEVHRKMKALAYLSLISAILSVVLAFAGGWVFGLNGAALGVVLGQFTYFALVWKTVVRKVSFYKGAIRPLVLSLVIMLFGYLLRMLINPLASGLDWWIAVIAWIVIFGLISLVVLWKGVAWGDFMKARLE
ncbi:hypothetical protein PS910_04303 [Pseudomonas fluorescens]|nr:hypothetical protein PS910_04303 [Pseudomonas fluorescens]